MRPTRKRSVAYELHPRPTNRGVFAGSSCAPDGNVIKSSATETIGSPQRITAAREVHTSVARPTKTLQEHLRDGSFRADRHAGLLLGPLVDDRELAGLQATYRTATSTDEQRLVAIAFAQEASCTRDGSRARS